MALKHRLNTVALTDKHRLRTLVENRRAYNLDHCELNIFETHALSHQVPLTFNDLVVTSMLRGKKVMHLFDHNGFEYLPGETVIVPPNVTMRIDFPEASEFNPTQCTALAIDQKQIRETIQYLNDRFPRTELDAEWSLDFQHYHFFNNENVAGLINKLIHVCTQDGIGKDILADLTIKELLVRIMQTQNLMIVNEPALPKNALSYVIGYIKANLHEKIQIDDLSNKACMSKATFHRTFKREFGMSPLEFVLIERVNKAKQLLAYPGVKVSNVSMELGFSDLNYFIRLFKKMEGVTPKQYQMAMWNVND